jgi:hypothetical protein
LAYSLKRSENYNKGKSRRKNHGLMTGGKKGVHFFGKGNCEKCTGKKQWRKKKNEEG